MDLTKAEQSIEKLMNAIQNSDAFNDPALLSNIMVRLAYLNTVVGRHLAGLQGAYRLKRREVYEQIMSEGGKVTRAKEESEQAAREEEERYDHYDNLHKDTQTFINVCQSHLRVLSLEAKSQI